MHGYRHQRKDGVGAGIVCAMDTVMGIQRDVQNIHKALAQLPVDYREAVVLRYHEELSMEEIATALGISVSGAKMRVHRWLKKLREILERGWNEEGKLQS